MIEISNEEYELFQKLKKIVLHSNAEKYPGVYFICGEGGSKDTDGLPEFILVCPAAGADHGLTVAYKKELRKQYTLKTMK